MKIRLHRLLISIVSAIACNGLLLPPAVHAQVDLNDLTSLSMAPFGGDFYHITVPSTGQLLTRIGPEVWQGNADIYQVDPTITSPGDPRRAGHYWSQFLMIGTDPDPEPGQVADFLTDRVESEGETLQSFNVIQSSGKVIEYEGTWTFRNLFTTTAHHWVWVDGEDHYHRVQVSMDVLSTINNVKAIWTEWFNVADAYGTVTAQTRDDGIQTLSALGTTNQHLLGEYELGRDDWLAMTDPQIGQDGSVARVLLSSTSDIRSGDEVTPIFADTTLFDNIELHIHRQFPTGVTLNAGTSFFMDNLVIMDPTQTGTSWINPKIERAKEWIDLIGPSIAPPDTPDPGSPVSRFFVPPGGTGNWSVVANWTPSPTPDSNDTAIIHAGRGATISSNVGSIGTLRLGDAGTGTLELQPGAVLQITNQALVGAGGGGNLGIINQTGGSLSITGGDPVMFLAYDSDDSADYEISDGELTVGNLWFRFGNGTLTQTGGTVNAAQLVLGEGGNPLTSALYDLQDGTFNVAGNANIGRAPGGENFPGSDLGSLQISGGVATFGDLLFGTDPTDQVVLSDSGVLRIVQSNYSVASALADIAAGNIAGVDLSVSTVDVGGVLYTQINAQVGLAGDYNDDGIVDAADYTIWRDTLGSTTDLRADGNNNHVIDDGDFWLWKSQFGASLGNASRSTETVPEPCSALLMALGCFVQFLRHAGKQRAWLLSDGFSGCKWDRY
jgi:hypothetical protein